MRTELFFHSAGDERGTPTSTFDALHAEFDFQIDFAASALNAKCPLYFGFGGVAEDALEQDWGGMTGFLNPPYSVAGAFVQKAREEADKGATVVMLLPVRSDTKWWHGHIYDDSSHTWRPGVECRLLKGRQQFTLVVPDAMRQTIKDALAVGLDEDDTIAMLVETTGLPKMAIAGIRDDKPDEDLLTSAPFPSCVVVFRKVEQ